MTLRLPNTDTMPPNGWRYVVPETGKRFSGSNLPQLLERLRDHYRGTGYTMPHDIAEKIQDFICSEERDYCGQTGHVATPKYGSSLGGLYHTFHAAVKCIVTLISHRAGGRSVTAGLAEGRASVCAACPKNTDIAPCSTCSLKTIRDLVAKIVGAKKTSRDAELKFCSVCHCENRTKIWTDHDAIWKFMSKAQKSELPPECWIVKEAKE